MKKKKKCVCGGKIIPKKQTVDVSDPVVGDYTYVKIIHRYCSDCGLMYI